MTQAERNHIEDCYNVAQSAHEVDDFATAEYFRYRAEAAIQWRDEHGKQ